MLAVPSPGDRTRASQLSQGVRRLLEIAGPIAWQAFGRSAPSLLLCQLGHVRGSQHCSGDGRAGSAL